AASTRKDGEGKQHPVPALWVAAALPLDALEPLAHQREPALQARAQGLDRDLQAPRGLAMREAVVEATQDRVAVRLVQRENQVEDRLASGLALGDVGRRDARRLTRALQLVPQSPRPRA